eukprot:2870962-Rhodomonas_salina.1
MIHRGSSWTGVGLTGQNELAGQIVQLSPFYPRTTRVSRNSKHNDRQPDDRQHSTRRRKLKREHTLGSACLYPARIHTHSLSHTNKRAGGEGYRPEIARLARAVGEVSASGGAVLEGKVGACEASCAAGAVRVGGTPLADAPRGPREPRHALARAGLPAPCGRGSVGGAVIHFAVEAPGRRRAAGAVEGGGALVEARQAQALCAARSPRRPRRLPVGARRTRLVALLLLVLVHPALLAAAAHARVARVARAVACGCAPCRRVAALRAVRTVRAHRRAPPPRLADAAVGAGRTRTARAVSQLVASLRRARERRASSAAALHRAPREVARVGARGASSAALGAPRVLVRPCPARRAPGLPRARVPGVAQTLADPAARLVGVGVGRARFAAARADDRLVGPRHARNARPAVRARVAFHAHTVGELGAAPRRLCVARAPQAGSSAGGVEGR